MTNAKLLKRIADKVNYPELDIIKESKEYQDIILTCTNVANLGGYELKLCIVEDVLIRALVSDGFMLTKRKEEYVIKW